MRMRTTFLADLLSSFDAVAVASIGRRAHYPVVEGSDVQRLRGDVARVGVDFATVLTREWPATESFAGATRAAPERR